MVKHRKDFIKSYVHFIFIESYINFEVFENLKIKSINIKEIKKYRETSKISKKKSLIQ